MSRVNFTKMVATGNDFVIVDNRDKEIGQCIGDFSQFAKVVCARKYSIGADGLLLVEDSDKADIAMRVFNPDGSEADMCGNGSRCIAYYANSKGLARNDLSIETRAGVLRAHADNSSTRIEITEPRDLRCKFLLETDGKNIEVNFVNTGVPHVIHFVENLDGVDVGKLGREIRSHKEFSPQGANVNFVKVHDNHSISIRTYERGVEDETFACGTGAVASSIVACELHFVESPVRVKTSGGEYLTTHFKKKGNQYGNVFLEGEVKIVYEGRIDYV